jgi:hypothetical protein
MKITPHLKNVGSNPEWWLRDYTCEVGDRETNFVFLPDGIILLYDKRGKDIGRFRVKKK